MRKKNFFTTVIVLTMCCFVMYLTGCFSNKGIEEVSSPTPTTVPNSVAKTLDTTPPAHTTTSTPTTPPNNATQTPDPMPSSQIASSTPAAPPNNAMQTPDPMPSLQIVSPTPAAPSTPTAPSKDEGQTLDATSTSQANPTEPANITGINTGLPDSTKVKLFVSGKEIHWAIIMGDEALVPDYPYTFGQLKDADGESANFWTITTVDVNTNIENALIYNSQYSIEIMEDEFSFTCNDETFPLTVPAQTIDKEFHVPLVALAEAINATVEWDADAQAIKFFYK